MKITMGSNVGMTITNMPYSPIKVESTLHIEKEVEELNDEELAVFVEEFNSKIEKILYKDLDKKMSDMASKQKDLKRKLERL